MLRTWLIWAGVCGAVWVFSSESAKVHAETLTDAKFRELHAQLQPSGDEPWRTIPWKIAILDAQRTAASENKPIFIWAMDGHPLGCT